MGLLDGKVALVFGLANNRSIAWGIVQALHEAGATIALSYANEALERRVRPLGEEVGAEIIMECDLSGDYSGLDAVFEAVKEKYGKIDILVHAVAFAPREDLGGRFIDVSREGFHTAMDISAYSLIAMAKRAEPLMPEGGSIMAMTYFAAEKVMPDYNAMAIAKASLETITRYLAVDMGPSKIRVNAISAGPIKTLAGAGIPGFRNLLRYFDKVAPLREKVNIEEVGQTALFLASDMSTKVTGEILHIDSGYNVLGLTVPREELHGESDSDD
ncbi:enoyl-ACP reductase [Phototrophicus methaneseepsis]|uniref:Enoyl-[acyl-carrier-protein] reductase [NADH] n=1 Tax=Phototrophicus methaneseepsis TaxID=2710758 RepID=A0A7S8E8B1_9CHLR|nr:enoyl-ACP reductase [Phototrophicus methaneseepsis]QPC82172.1 enoyl-ACP reductase [Phototrophicus methaneseepsis]